MHRWKREYFVKKYAPNDEILLHVIRSSKTQLPSAILSAAAKILAGIVPIKGGAWNAPNLLDTFCTFPDSSEIQFEKGVWLRTVRQ